MIALRKLADLTPVEIIGLQEMSYSRINNYELCPTKYFYSYVVKSPETFGPAAVLGNIIHKVLEIHVGEEEPLRPVEIQLTYQQSREEYDPDHLITEDLLDAGWTMLLEFVDRHESDFVSTATKPAAQVVGKEQGFQFVIGNFYVRGYIDRVDQISPTELKICDYKSGKFQVAQKWAEQNLQLNIYVLALLFEHPEIETVVANLYYLRSGKLIGHRYTRTEDMERLVERLYTKLLAIQNDEHFHPTPNEHVCGFCDHATTGACATGKFRRQKRIERGSR